LLGRSTAGAGTVEEIACTAFGRSILDDANEAAFKATVNLEIGTDVLAQQTIGIADNNLLEVDGTPNAAEYARFTATGLEGRTEAEFKADFNLEIGTDVQAYAAALDSVSGTNTGDQTITLTGDVTGSGTGSFAATIASDAVTYDKMQDTSGTDVLLGRSTAGAGTVEEIACTAFGRSILDDANEAAFKATVNLEIGTDVQAYAAALDSVSGINTGDEVAATTSVSGISELATTAEIDTGTDTGRTITPDALAGSYAGTKTVQLHLHPALSLTTGDGKVYFVVSDDMAGMNIVRVHARVITAGTTGTTDFQLRNVTQAADILSTKLTIDSTETGSDTAATPAVIDTAEDDLTLNDLIAVDIDAVSTTAPKGLLLTIEARLP